MTPGIDGPRGISLQARRIGYSARSAVSRHPRPYLAIARLKYPEHGKEPEIVDRHTELVIEGYPRSANTFAVVAFQLAQGTPVKVAHHLHASSQLIAAAKWGISALALIRQPEEAIISEALRKPGISVRQAANSFVGFYSSLEPYRGYLTVGLFDEVTRDFGAVIGRMNREFGTSFQLFDHSEQNVKEVFDLIEERTRRSPIMKYMGYLESGLITAQEFRQAVDSFGTKGTRPALTPREAHFIARPSKERDAKKETIRARFWHPDLARVRRRAFALYERFASG
jgi:hypothetical protein